MSHKFSDESESLSNKSEENDEIQTLGIELEIDNLYQKCQFIVNDEEIMSEDEIDKNLVVGYAIMNE